MQNTTSRAALLLTVAVAGLITLTACSADQGDAKPSSKPSASASAKASGAQTDDKSAAETGADDSPFVAPPADLPTHAATCTDGVATVDQSNAKIVLDGACARVVVNASNSVIELGATTDLVVNGTINSVTATGVETLSIEGNGNLVTLDSEPKVSDNGSDNVVDSK